MFRLQRFLLLPPSFPLLWQCVRCLFPWRGGSWLGCQELPAMRAVLHLGAGFKMWKLLGDPGTQEIIKNTMKFESGPATGELVGS